MSLNAGVIAVQGDVSEHADAIRRAGTAHGESVSVTEIRQSGIVPNCDLLCMPGGESTAISRLLQSEGIAPEIQAHVEAGKPILATCAGLIVAAADAGRRPRREPRPARRDRRAQRLRPPEGQFRSAARRDRVGRPVPGRVHPCAAHQRGGFGEPSSPSGTDDPSPYGTARWSERLSTRN